MAGADKRIKLIQIKYIAEETLQEYRVVPHID